MTRLSAAEVQAGTGGTLVSGPGAALLTGVSIDTRTLLPGDLFFAIRGPRLDGHRFIAAALSAGARGVVAERGYRHPGPFPPGCVLIEVDDTHGALKALAGAVRAGWPGTLVAVTGSMGKTTTRQFAAGLLSREFPVHQTPGNFNNLYGLPLALLGLEPGHRLGIFEMGMSAAGEIAEMCRIARPDVGILTNVAPVHLEFFDSVDAIARAKAELAESLPPDGLLVYNADDGRVGAIAARYRGDTISFGLSPAAEVRAEEIRVLGPEATRFTLTCPGYRGPAELPFAGVHFVLDALPGVALGRRWGMEPETIVAGLRELRPAAMRGGVLRFAAGFALIDDSYNSNPGALMGMIDTLAEMPYFSRRVLVAGEMRELGSGSAGLHFECGLHAARRGVDLVVGVAGDAAEIVRAGVESGLTDSRFFADADAASGFVAECVRPGDLVLIKGSRGVHMEKIVGNLRSRFPLAHGRSRENNG